MSDYVRRKVIRYPLDDRDCHDLFDRINLSKKDEPFDIVGCLDYNQKGDPQMVFLDYILIDTYGEDCGDFGKVRELHPSEKDKYGKIFGDFFEGLLDIDKDKLRLVDYCYYNCCEPQAYYSTEFDPFYEEV